MGLLNRAAAMVWGIGQRARLVRQAIWATDGKDRRIGYWGGSQHGGEGWAEDRVSVDGSNGAIKLSAWWAGVRLTAQTIASLPGGMFEIDRSGNKVAARDHALHGLLRDSPNASQTGMEFWEAQSAGICIVGNSFAEIVRNGQGDVVALNHLPFDQTQPKRKDDGRLVYEYTDRGRQEELPADKVFHTKGFGFGGDLGLSPIAAAAGALGGALATEKASARMFAKGMRAAGFMLSPTTLDDKQRGQLQKNVIDPITGPKGEGKVGVLEAGFKWQPANIPPKDAEMILSRKFNVEDVCRWLGVPPILVGHAAEGQTMWGSGVEHIMQAWLSLGLRAYLVRYEQSIRKRLLRPEERGKFFWEWNIEGLLRGDSQARGEFYSKLAQVAAINPNLIAAKENLPAVPGGDRYFVNSTMVPLDQAGQQQQQQGSNRP